MADIQSIANLARRKGLNYTGRLNRAQAEALAIAWRPEVRFHEDERFHPVDVNGLFLLPKQVFDSLANQDAFTIEVDNNRFAPPVLRNGSTVVDNGEFEAASLANASVDKDTILTHGRSFEFSTQFFGASDTIQGLPNPTPGDPREPRHDIVYRAEVRMLFETLKFELELDDLEPGEEKPVDSIWRGFNVENSFFREIRGKRERPDVFPRQAKRDILKSLVDAYDPDNPDFQAESAAIDAAIAATPDGWVFVGNAWEVIKSFAFVEYYFVYGFNDFNKYEGPFANEHEGDDEGCCVVFARKDLDDMADDFQNNPPDGIAPVAFITSVHEEWQNGDRIDTNVSKDPSRAREDLIAYVARGSHATYLDAGAHDALDFGDAFELPFQGPTWLKVVSVLTLGLPGLISAIGEHFADSDDKTSNDGVSTPGPSDAPTDSPLVFDAATVVTALSNISDADDGNEQNIYGAATGPGSNAAALSELGRRAFAGKIGAHSATSDISPNFKTKTARYFRKLLEKVESGAIDIPGGIIEG